MRSGARAVLVRARLDLAAFPQALHGKRCLGLAGLRPAAPRLGPPAADGNWLERLPGSRRTSLRSGAEGGAPVL